MNREPRHRDDRAVRLKSWLRRKEDDLLRLPGRLRDVFQTLFLSIHEFRRSMCIERAGNLSYATLLSLIPVAVLFFSFAGLFGGGERIILYAKERLFPMVAAEFHEQLSGWLEANISTTAFREGPVQLVNVVAILALLTSALGMLVTAERFFNIIWRVERKRSYLQKAGAFWVILTTSPFLIAASISIGDYLVPKGGTLEGVIEGSWLLGAVYGFVVPLVISFVGFTTLFSYLPNTRVAFRSAAFGGIVAALLWGASKQGFFLYVSWGSEVRSLYGQLATVPLFLIWVFISWLITLAGAVLSYVHQNRIGLLRRRLFHPGNRRYSRLFLGFELLRAIDDSFQKGVPTPRVLDLAAHLALPAESFSGVAATLVENGFLVEDGKSPDRFVPALSPATIRWRDVALCLLKDEFAGDHDVVVQAMQQRTDESPAIAAPPLAAAWAAFFGSLGDQTLAAGRKPAP